MLKILCSSTSPYSSKVRMAAKHLGIRYREVMVDTNAAPPELVDSNPLGKIPVLIHAKDKAVYDSRAIMQYLNRRSKGRLYPSKDRKRTEAEVLEALSDGICDCLLAIVYEQRARPEDKQFEGWIERQWTKVVRGLAMLEQNPPKIGKRLNGGHFALAALMGYLALRFEGRWEADHPQLVNWTNVFVEHFQWYDAMKPQA